MKRKKDSAKKSGKMVKIPANLIGRMRADIASLDEKIKTDITPAIVASFGFIIALVWRDAIKAGLDEFLLNTGLSDQAYLYNFISAIIVTIVVIGIMIAVSKYGKSKKEKRINKVVEEKKLETDKLLGEKDGKK